MRYANIKTRFWNNVMPEPMSGCWIWTAGVDHFGYGRICYKGRNAVAHRLSLELNGIEIPPGAFVCHKCDVPPCVNPDHLYIGDVRTNSDDKVRKRRHVFGATVPNAKLNDDIVRNIRRERGSLRQIASKYGIGQTAVHSIRHNRTWTHVDG